MEKNEKLPEDFTDVSLVNQTKRRIGLPALHLANLAPNARQPHFSGCVRFSILSRNADIYG
jgi:hypothetical protein